MNLSFDKKQILDNLEEVCRRLFPNGKKVGSHFQIGSVSGETGQSLKITWKGSRGNDRGTCIDFQSMEKFDIIGLWQKHNSFATPLEAYRAFNFNIS